MSVATLRSSQASTRSPAPAPARHQRADGGIALSIARAAGSSVVADLAQRVPCRALFPRPASPGVPLAVLLNTSGGLAGGDRISVTMKIGPGAAATATTQAAEKVYRSLGPDARVETALAVAAEGRLEWLPQETILFDGACLERHISAAVAHGGRLLACETLVFGRAARGEVMNRGRLLDRWRIEYGGRLVWVDRLGLAIPVRRQLDGAGFGGARALATALYVGPEADTLLPVAREAAVAEGGAASLVNGILVARLLGAEPSRVRDGVARLLRILRSTAFGIETSMAALWAA